MEVWNAFLELSFFKEISYDSNQYIIVDTHPNDQWKFRQKFKKIKQLIRVELLLSIPFKQNTESTAPFGVNIVFCLNTFINWMKIYPWFFNEL